MKAFLFGFEYISLYCLQCFDPVSWAAEGHPACKKTEWWGAGVVICLEQGADLHMAQLMPLPLTVFCFSKIQIGSLFWYQLTRVVPDKGPLNGCVCVCVPYSMHKPKVLHVNLTQGVKC